MRSAFQSTGDFQRTPGVQQQTVVTQLGSAQAKWNPNDRSSPFRTYLYNNVGQDAARLFQPGPNDDAAEWEEALRKRPGPTYVPVLVQGFSDLGKRVQKEKNFLDLMQTRLHEINNALTELLSRHDLKISIKVAACRRKHLVLSQRCLALAAKTQILRNRGYTLDESEVDFNKKLQQLERSVLDPSLIHRAEDIWARMLAFRDESKRLQQELEQFGGSSRENGPALDGETIKMTKKILEDYGKQIQHLDSELAALQKQFSSIQTPS